MIGPRDRDEIVPRDPARKLNGAAHPIQRVPSLDWRALATCEPPPRDWILRSWIAAGNATLVSGAGGIGKTLLMQTVSTALVLGHDYIDSVPQARRVLFWAGEDDTAELWRRQLAICKPFGIDLMGLPEGYQLKSYYSHDITLASVVFGELTETPMMRELREQVGDYKADVVVLDSVARVFGGSENDRHQVTTFISWLARACAPTNAAVVLIGHPGKAASAEFSGSTAWEASVRSRLYFGSKLPDEEPDDDDQPDDGARFLCRRKANYSAKDWCRLNYRDGVLVPEEMAQKSFSPVGPDYAKDVVLNAVRKLSALSEHVTSSTASPAYLPKVAQKFGLLDRLSKKQFAAAMIDLRKSGSLVVAKVGEYGNRNAKMGLVESAGGLHK